MMRQRLHSKVVGGRRRRWVICAGLLLMAFCTVIALAQTDGGYDLSWNSIDGGGQTSTGGDYALTGIIGQPEAGVLTGGEYAVEGGFLSVGSSHRNAAMLWQIYD